MIHTASQQISKRNVGHAVVTRRDATALGAAAMAALLLPRVGAAADTAEQKLRARAIPHSGEMLPVVGVGTAMVFDIGSNPQEQAGCTEVVRALAANGGTLIDTAPSYGTAESVIGGILASTSLRHQVFLATRFGRHRKRLRGPAAGCSHSSYRARPKNRRPDEQWNPYKGMAQRRDLGSAAARHGRKGRNVQHHPWRWC